MHFNCTRFFLTWSSCKCHSEGPEGNHGNVCSGGHRIASKCLSVFRYLTLYHKQTSDQEHGSDVFWLQVCSWVFRYPIQVAQTNTGFWSGCRSVGLPSFSLTCSFPFPVCVFMGVATSSSWDTPEVHQLITCSYKSLVSPPLQCQIVMSRSVITPVLLLTLSVLSQRCPGFCSLRVLAAVFFLRLDAVSRPCVSLSSCADPQCLSAQRCFFHLQGDLIGCELLLPVFQVSCSFVRSFPSQWWRIIFWSSSHLSLSAVTENGWGQKRLEKKNAYGSRVCNTFCSASESTSLQSSVQNIYIHYWHHRLRLNRNDTERP